MFFPAKTAVIASAITLVAGTVQAQEFCAGAGADGQWIGGSEASSDITTADTYREQMALVLSGNTHISLFSVSAPTDVRIEAAGRGNGDPAIDIFDAGGAIVMSDDDSGGNGASRAELTLNPGTYCVATASYDGSPMTAFVRIARAEQEALTQGVDTSATQTAPASGDCSSADDMGTLAGTLNATGSASEHPYWRFSLSEQTAISIRAENEDADTVIALYDADNALLGENDDFDGLNSRLEYPEGLPAGEYCLKVDALDDVNLPIDLTVDIYDPEAALADLYASGEAAPPMDGTVAITNLGEIASRARHDEQIGDDASWYSFAVPEAGMILIEALGTPGGNVDPWIALYDDLGRQIDMNDDNGDSLDSQIAARVNRGTYMLAVKHLGDGQMGVRILLERFVAAQ